MQVRLSLLSMLLVSLAWCGDLRAAVVLSWLYEVSIPVESQSRQERQSASSKALLIALTRLTGLAHVPRTPEVTAALQSPESYYNEFRFVAGQTEAGLELVIQFDSVPLLELVKAADLPIWRSSRRRVIAWVVVEDGVTRSLLGATGESIIVDAMNNQAKIRGIPLLLPLLDLQDQLQVTPAAVWGRLSQVLEPASKRYGAEVVLVGRAEIAESGQWLSDWEFWLEGRVIPWHGSEGDLLDQAVAVVDVLADELAARSAVLGRETRELQVSIDGIRTPADYAELLQYLESLEFVDSVGVTQLQGTRLSLLLSTRAAPEQLLGLLQADRRLFNDRLAIAGQADLRLVWRRR